MTWKTFLALLMGALFLGSFGCEINQPGTGDDDDDIPGDDDDTTMEFAATIGGQSDEPGDFTMQNGTEIGACTDETLCTMDVDEPYPYTVRFETEHKLFVRKATHIEETDHGVENIATFDSNQDPWGVKLDGTYDAYDTEDSYLTTYEFETSEDGTNIVLMIVGLASYTIDEYTYADGAMNCESNSDGSYVDCGTGGYWIRN